VLPVEITDEAQRIVAYDESASNEALQDDVDALDEARDVALAISMQYQQNLIITIALEFGPALSWWEILYCD
jgi:hypothetical protein